MKPDPQFMDTGTPPWWHIPRPRQVILLSGVLVMLLIGSVLGYWSWQSRKQALERASEVTQAFAIAYAAFTDRTFDTIEVLMGDVAAYPAITQRWQDSTAPPDVPTFLRDRIAQVPIVRDMILLDVDGTVRAWTGTGTPPDILSDPAYIAHRDAGNRRPWLSPVRPTNPGADGSTGGFYFALVRTIRDADDRPVGSIVALIDQAEFSAAYRTILRSVNASVTLVHFDGTVMARLPDPGTAIGSRIPIVAERDPPGVAPAPFMGRSPVDGLVRIISEQAVGSFPAFAAVTMERDAALAPWSRDMAWGLGVFLVAAMAVTTLTYALMRLETRQTAARVTLQRQNTVLTAQQETSTDGILVSSPDGRILSWNKRFVDLWGVSDEIMAANDSDALRRIVRHKIKDPDAFVRRITFLYQNLDVEELEGVEVHLTDGRILERYSRGLRREDGTGWGRVWFYRDITQRRSAERALRESEQRFRDVANAADEYIWEVDRTSALTFLSERVVDILGYPPARLLGRNPLEFIAKEDKTWVTALFRDAMISKCQFELPEYRVTTASGAIVWQRTSGVPVFDDTGAVQGFRGLSMNISDLKARELELQQANTRLEDQARALVELAERIDASNRAIRRVQERFDLAMRGSTDGLYDWDLRTNRIYLSPRWREMLGLGDTEAEVEPAYCTSRIVIEDYLDTVRALSAHLWGRDPIYRHVQRLRHADGHTLWILDRAQVVRDTDGQPVRLVGTHSDITEMRHYEEALQQAKVEAEAANAAKSRFLAVMSHEIRTPMTGVLGMADLLLTSGLDARQLSYAETLKRSADTLLGLLNDILDFSKIEAGQLVLDEIDFDPRQITEDVIQLFSFNASEKGLRLEAVMCESLPPVLRGDPSRLRQILFNLVSNAIKFTHTGRVHVIIEQVDPVPDGRLRLTVSVTDTGIGLSAEQCERLFEPFVQADNTTTRQFGGTGLGLAICKRLVELMDGSIWVESTPGQGSTFRFQVMVDEGQADTVACGSSRPGVTARPDLGARRAAPGHRLLLAEDTLANRLLLATMLERMGFAVDEVGDGQAALEAVSADPARYALVLMDMQMPVMDGVEATRAIRALPDSPPPVLGLTADAITDNHRMYLASGLADVLTKPVDWDKLIRAVGLHARGVRWLDAASVHDSGSSDGQTQPKPKPKPKPQPMPHRPPHDRRTALPPDDSVPLFDPTSLESLSARVDMARLHPILASMLTTATHQIDDLMQAHQSGTVDADSVGRFGHMLKGLAGQFGAVRLAMAAQALEAERPTGADLAEALSDIQATADATQGCVERWLEASMETQV